MTEKEAQARYRAAWMLWRVEKSAEKRKKHEQAMDAAQPFIATSPRDPRWRAFTATLAGFDALWGNV